MFTSVPNTSHTNEYVSSYSRTYLNGVQYKHIVAAETGVFCIDDVHLGASWRLPRYDNHFL